MAWVFYQLEAVQMQKKKPAINTASASKIFMWMKYESHGGEEMSSWTKTL